MLLPNESAAFPYLLIRFRRVDYALCLTLVHRQQVLTASLHPHARKAGRVAYSANIARFALRTITPTIKIKRSAQRIHPAPLYLKDRPNRHDLLATFTPWRKIQNLRSHCPKAIVDSPPRATPAMRKLRNREEVLLILFGTGVHVYHLTSQSQ